LVPGKFRSGARKESKLHVLIMIAGRVAVEYDDDSQSD
jgi:hypothetical protein